MHISRNSDLDMSHADYCRTNHHVNESHIMMPLIVVMMIATTFVIYSPQSPFIITITLTGVNVLQMLKVA